MAAVTMTDGRAACCGAALAALLHQPRGAATLIDADALSNESPQTPRAHTDGPAAPSPVKPQPHLPIYGFILLKLLLEVAFPPGDIPFAEQLGFTLALPIRLAH